jgi:hypothetical protein
VKGKAELANAVFLAWIVYRARDVHLEAALARAEPER